MKKIFVLCIVSATMGGIIATGIQNHLSGRDGMVVALPPGTLPNQETQQRQLTPSQIGNTAPNPDEREFTSEDTSAISVYEAANQSTVNINVSGERVQRNGFFLERVKIEGSGSGWVLDRDGHVVTNHHVVLDSDNVEVTLFDGSSYPATVIGVDPPNDVAVLKVNAPAALLQPATLGDSSTLKIGQRIFAIGNPFGLERTMTTGIISSLNRSLPAKTTQRTIRNVIQIDAALNQGNSGGPLLDRQSRLVGMNTAIASTNGGNTGVGFAVPVNTIRRIVAELIKHGRIVRADMGLEKVMITDLGLLVVELNPNGPAAAAGIKPVIVREIQRVGNVMIQREGRDPDADILQSIDGAPVTSADDLHEILDSKRPGQTIDVGLLREGKQVVARVTLVSD